MNDHFLLYYLVMAQVLLSLLQNNAVEAHQLMDGAASLIRSNDSLYEKGLLNFVLGRLALLEENPYQAIERLKEAERCFSEDGRKMESDANRIWLMVSYYQAENYSAARQITQTILDVRGQIEPGMLVAVHQARKWLDGLQKDPEVGRVIGDLLTRASRMTRQIPAIRRHLHRMPHVLQMPNPHLIIHAFGKTSVSVGGKLLTLSDWQTQSVRDLFFYFLNNKKALTREQVAEALWPDIDDPHKIKLRFKNEIYRLRRAVGQDVVTYEDVFYSFNHALDFEYDVEAFESFLARAKKSKNIEEQIRFYQKAVDLVRGPYLVDIYADWAMVERERLSQTYLATMLVLAELLQKQARYEQALSICRRALDYDLTFEAAYVLSMQIYYRMGDRASIIRTYQTCNETLQRQLGFPPSNDTDHLYRRLIA
jgi:two-component SAPR family response regulator